MRSHQLFTVTFPSFFNGNALSQSNEEKARDILGAVLFCTEQIANGPDFMRKLVANILVADLLPLFQQFRFFEFPDFAQAAEQTLQFLIDHEPALAERSDARTITEHLEALHKSWSVPPHRYAEPTNFDAYRNLQGIADPLITALLTWRLAPLLVSDIAKRELIATNIQAFLQRESAKENQNSKPSDVAAAVLKAEVALEICCISPSVARTKKADLLARTLLIALSDSDQPAASTEDLLAEINSPTRLAVKM